MRAIGIPIAALLVALTLGSRAQADDATVKADTLFNEGNALAAAGRYAEACPKLAESQRIEPAVGTQFNLADCYEHLGRTATAFGLFTDVARIARAAGKFERERLAKERALALEPRLPHVRITPRAPAAGLEIKVDDNVIPREKWSSAVPIDPGRHTVTASAPNRTPWSGNAEAAEGKTTDLAIPELVDPTPPRPVAEARPRSSTQRTLAIAIGGAGIAALAVGGIAGAMSLSARGSAEEACPAATYAFRCPTVQGADDWNSATTAGNVSTIGFVVAGVVLAGAAILWLTAPSKSRATASAF